MERGERRHVGHLRAVRLPAQCAQEHERRLPLLGRAAQRAVGPGDAQHAQRRRPVAGAHQHHELGQRVCRLDGALHDGQPGKLGHQACPCDGVEGETAGLLPGERPLHPRVLLLPDRTHLGRCPAAALGLRIDRHGAVPRTHPRIGSADARGTRHCRRGKVRRRYVGQDRGHAGRRGDAEGRLCPVDVPYAGRGRGLPGDGPRGARGTRPVGRPARARVCRYFQFVEQMRPRGHFRRAPGCVGSPERPGLLPRLERELRRSGLPQQPRPHHRGQPVVVVYRHLPGPAAGRLRRYACGADLPHGRLRHGRPQDRLDGETDGARGQRHTHFRLGFHPLPLRRSLPDGGRSPVLREGLRGCARSPGTAGRQGLRAEGLLHRHVARSRPAGDRRRIPQGDGRRRPHLVDAPAHGQDMGVQRRHRGAARQEPQHTAMAHHAGGHEPEITTSRRPKAGIDRTGRNAAV